MIAILAIFSIIFIYYDVVTRYKVIWPESPESKMLKIIEGNKKGIEIKTMKNNPEFKDMDVADTVYKLMRYHNVRKNKSGNNLFKEEDVGNLSKLWIKKS